MTKKQPVGSPLTKAECQAATDLERLLPLALLRLDLAGVPRTTPT